MKLVFVYASDSGLFNLITEIAHKLLSPSTYPCQLCALTHGTLVEKKEWAEFLKTVSTPKEFLHRDEFQKRFPAVKVDLPAVFVFEYNELRPFLTREAIEDCKTVTEFIACVKEKI